MLKIKALLLLAASMLVVQAHADTRVNIVGLFSDKALVMINGGAPQSLHVGQTVNGVKLISANSESATLMVEGRRQVLKMGQAMEKLPLIKMYVAHPNIVRHIRQKSRQSYLPRHKLHYCKWLDLWPDVAH